MLTEEDIFGIAMEKMYEVRMRKISNGDYSIACLDGMIKGEEPEVTALVKKLCKENNIPYSPEIHDFEDTL